MMKSIISAAGLIAAASAFTQPVQPPTFGSLYTPDVTTPVTTGQAYTITWAPGSASQTVSLVLCNGPSSNCVLQSSAIVEGVSASAGSYSWNVPCSLPEGTQNTASGYGMLIIVDGTGEFQYSTQFSVQKGASCSSSVTTTTTTSASSSSSSTSSSSVTTSSVARPTTGTDAGRSWLGWSTSSSGYNSTTMATYTAPSSKYSTSASSAAAVTTSASASYTYVKPSSSSAATTTSAVPSAFTGAAALPTAFVNVAGLVGAGLAILAL